MEHQLVSANDQAHDYDFELSIIEQIFIVYFPSSEYLIFCVKNVITYIMAMIDKSISLTE